MPDTQDFCCFCGYDVSGSAGRCPECGRPVSRFTDRVKAVAAGANAHAIRLHNLQSKWLSWYGHAPAIRPLHLLMGLLSGPGGLGITALRSVGVEPSAVRRDLEKLSPRTFGRRFAAEARLTMHPTANRVIRSAIVRAADLEQDWVGTEHLLLGLIDSPDRACARAFARHGVEEAAILAWSRDNNGGLEFAADDSVGP